MRSIAIVTSAAVVALVAQGLLVAHSLQFETAAIKPNVSGSLSGGAQFQPSGRVTVTNTTIRDMIRNVFNLPDLALIGGPAWLASERYDIVAKANGDPSREQLIQMLRALLTERFKLVFRQETREMPIYTLVPLRGDGRLGPRLVATKTDCMAIDSSRSGPPPCGIDQSAGGSLNAVGMPIARLVRTLAQASGRTVVDKTGLMGLYDFSLSWTPDDAAVLGDAPSLFTALQEQLGLKLESGRDQAQVLVIERAERPTDN